MALRIMSYLGGPRVRAGLVFEGCAALLLWGRWRPALLLAATVSITGAVTRGLKEVTDRNRPQPILRLQLQGESFPSGHASGTTALAGASAYIVWLLTGRAIAAAVVAAGGGLLAALVGYSRVKLHRHHTGDVLAGHALGIGCVAIAVAIERQTRGRSSG
jgi:undecaprenyl-diphosphatase